MPISNLQFVADMERLAGIYEDRIMAVVKMSTQDVFELAQEVGPSRTNPSSTGTGRMPVGPTGFLRASAVVRLNADPPPANRENPNADGKYNWDAAAITLVISGMEIGDRATIGWTAAYARHVNYGTSKMSGYHFVENASGQWQQIVRRNVERAKGIAA